MPEKTLRKLNTYIPSQWKVAFFSAIIVGLFAHLYKITSWIPNWDSLVFRYDSQNMIGLGRWFLPVACSATSFYDLPFLNGIVSIIFHALGAVCICKVLSVEKKITASIIGALTISFPTVTSVLMYNYVADGYGIAFFLSALAAVLMTNEKPRYFLSAILIALSAGIYQAYLTVTIMLLLLRLIDEIIYRNASAVAILKKGLFMALTGVAGLLIYSAILKVLLAVFSTELLDYQGMSETASFSNINIPASLYIVKETFIRLFFDPRHDVNVYLIANIFVFIFTAFYYLKTIFKSGIYKNVSKLVVVSLLTVLLVIGAGALAFINASIDYHSLMLMGYFVFYLFFVIIYERGEKSDKAACFKCWTVLIVSAIIIANQVVIANVSYHKGQMAYERSYGVLIRIADRIEETEGAEDCDRILVVGALDNSESYSVDLPPNVTGITDGYIIRADDETVGQSVVTAALRDYCEKDFDFLYGDEKKEFLQKDQVKAMEKWPSESSVAVIDNTIVIKLGTEGEN